ncbi:aminotransferase class V-fold PLP-dependent enzyme [Exiguobacterium sp. SH1S21]|uniref:GNAT family N-acetyltransferase n=1 Tax=Exiguobacterium sp. SH1S21 TaxID=2510953 RepID=UPI00103C7780|nr:GNAT family N-acetyltransferase [Exiguobacterium sp. SH1S21]TCI57702.1 aminotransferase class V-fold PLP-dependent enzyme [Exiguobacterium sp. SH1S21]
MVEFRKAMPNDEEAIHRLNYETFVEEIPQHQVNLERRLVDRFHNTNTYWIGEADGKLVAMCSIRDEHPFSLEQKGVTLPPGEWIEVRLLAIIPAYRNTRTFAGLMRAMLAEAIERNVEGIVISGTIREQKLYRRFGFIPFADPVGPEEALYIPMKLTRAAFMGSETARTLRPKLLLAGPVELSNAVRAALATQPLSHRSAEAIRVLRSVETKLSTRINLPHIYTLLGSGTVANDAVAAQLTGRGLIFDTGEFGRRLIDHARRARLEFDVLTLETGKRLPVQQIERYKPDWIWTVHCETSTGKLVDVEGLRQYVHRRKTILAIDAISTVGTFETDYAFANMVTFVSGKALRNAPGLAFVAMRDRPIPNSSIPRYLDLASYNPIAFTQSVPLIQAMDIALDELTEKEVSTHQSKMDVCLKELLGRGVAIETGDDQSPGILSIMLPEDRSSIELGRQLAYYGYHIQYESMYLQQLNCVQVSTMGWTTERDMQQVAAYIGRWLQKKTVTQMSDGIRHENLDGPNGESFDRGVLN